MKRLDRSESLSRWFDQSAGTQKAPLRSAKETLGEAVASPLTTL
jgi:hypothetical protein